MAPHSGGNHVALQPDATIEKPYGWVFFHNSREWLATNDPQWALVGSAPIIIGIDGEIRMTGIPVDEFPPEPTPMSQKVVDQYVRWFIRHVRDETLKRISNNHRANAITDPDDPLHRGPYHRLLRAGIPEAALPAVLDLLIHSVDAALELALFQEDQLRTAGHLRVSLLASPEAADKPANWVELSNQYVTWHKFIPWVEESAEIRSAADLDALIRSGPTRVGGEWEDPVAGPADDASDLPR